MRLDHDWSSVVDVAQEEAPTDDAWADAITERLRGAFATKTDAVVSIVEHDAACASARYRSFRPPPGVGSLGEHVATAGLGLLGVTGFRAVYYPSRGIATTTEIEEGLERDRRADLAERSRAFRHLNGVADAFGGFAYPEPGVIVSIYAFHDERIRVSRYERSVITRVMMHIESAYRLHRRPESVKAVLDLDGNVLERTDDAPPNEVLGVHARRRSRASSELWPALVAGRLSLVRRGRGRARRYLAVENPPHAQSLRSLTAAEVEVVSQAARGHPTKLIAFALGLSSSAVSMRLASACSKLGAATRSELVRIAAMLVRDPRASFEDSALTEAERDVLELLQRGLTNEEIATIRSRSVRTIANQVASLLRKTKSTSRRDLLARA